MASRKKRPGKKKTNQAKGDSGLSTRQARLRQQRADAAAKEEAENNPPAEKTAAAKKSPAPKSRAVAKPKAKPRTVQGEHIPAKRPAKRKRPSVETGAHAAKPSGAADTLPHGDLTGSLLD